MTLGSLTRRISRTLHLSDALHFWQSGRVKGSCRKMGFFLRSGSIKGHSLFPGIRTAPLEAFAIVSCSILRVGARARRSQPRRSQATTVEVVMPARMGFETAQDPDSMISSAAFTSLWLQERSVSLACIFSSPRFHPVTSAIGVL